MRLSCYFEKNKTNNSPAFFDISNGSQITFKNMIFIRNEIHVQNAEVRFSYCTFIQSMIFSVEPKIFRVFENRKTRIEDTLFTDILKDGSCEYATLIFHQTTFNYSGITIDAYMDTFFKTGIRVICKSLRMEINEAIFESQLVNIISCELDLTVTNAIFSGSSTSATVPINFALFLYTPYYNIQFQNVTFTNIYFSALLVLLFLNRHYALAAFMLHLHELEELDSYNSSLPRGKVEFSDCVFFHNHRAISLYLPNKNHSVYIVNSSFIDNQSNGDGGAIYVTSLEEYNGGNVIIQDCEFSNNAAGVTGQTYPPRQL